MLGDEVAGDRERVTGSLTAMRDDPGLLAGRTRAGLAELVGCGLATEPSATVGFCFGGSARVCYRSADTLCDRRRAGGAQGTSTAAGTPAALHVVANWACEPPFCGLLLSSRS